MVISDPSQPYTTQDNVLAYRPNFVDSNTAILFVNLEAIFPCYRSNEIVPVCQFFTFDKGNIHRGKPYVQASGIGNNFRVFNNSQNIATYGLGVPGCPELDFDCGAVSGQNSINAELLLVCLQPPALNDCGT